MYLEKVRNTEKLESQLQKQKIVKTLERKKEIQKLGLDIPDHLKFSSPLGAFSQVLASEKGITYKFQQRQPLLAPRSGRVIYNGELANYGKVLMLDHGGDVRTVLLGRFQSDLVKNAHVSPGDVLGYTEETTDSIYFEVRKKNVAQKTIHWMDTATVGKI
jgi:murein DD-endopeptidase MepM/ murein hydrolase activator NlpD